MVAHRAKITTANGDFIFGVRGALGVMPVAPAVQDEDISIEFLDKRGIRRRYAFRTFSEFFHVIRDASVPVEWRDTGHE